ncbi:hypothetical protein ANCDUO_03851 [Ancylostoma duodenale]|uniref:Uncharacterized protein n=1 Tax=Ancylostoma duodenale TaxID=51022 RepID=A0A0C2D805_9BILA|nr:hypothetical protein ANCDUO_03851 [Ancylostoma duodenale]
MVCGLQAPFALVRSQRKKFHLLGKPELQLKEDELPADEDDLKKDEEVRLKILNWIDTDHPQLVTLAEDGELSDKEGKDSKKDKEKQKDEKKRDATSESKKVGSM